MREGRSPRGAGEFRYPCYMKLRDVRRHMDALESEPERHLAFVQRLTGKDMRRLWRSLPGGQKRLLQTYHRALLARAVEYLG